MQCIPTVVRSEGVARVNRVTLFVKWPSDRNGAAHFLQGKSIPVCTSRGSPLIERSWLQIFAYLFCLKKAGLEITRMPSAISMRRGCR